MSRDRIAFWNANHAMALVALGSVSNREDAVIVVADLRDPIGRGVTNAFAEALEKDTDLQAHEAKILKKNEIPTAVMIMPAKAAALALDVPNPTIAGVLRQGSPAPGCCFAVIISGGGSTLLQTPNAPVEPLGSG